jgi:hypothetical protein
MQTYSKFFEFTKKCISLPSCLLPFKTAGSIFGLAPHPPSGGLIFVLIVCPPSPQKVG